MTQLKHNQQDKIKDKEKILLEELDKKDTYLFCLNEKRIQACAWILLTIGLCIIITTFYLAIHKKPEYSADEENSVGEEKSDDDYNFNVGKKGGAAVVDADEEWSNGDNKGRIVLEDIIEVITNNLSGCHERLCQIACTRSENIYTSLYDTMKSSSCPSIDVLLLDRQDFPSEVLKNYWMPINLTIHEVIIRSTTLKKIKNNAFNSPIFRNTLVMNWFHLDIEKLESGALLGLGKLKYLTIDSRIRKIEPALFQPVQTTLSHLKFNGNIILRGNQNLFGISYMKKLEYLDLSNSIFKGFLESTFFESTPNLKYLLLVQCKLTHIDENAFENLKDKLLFINLSKNQLVTLAAGVLRPILSLQRTAMISLRGNDWNCDCKLQELAKLYKDYRIQFMDALYCKAPHNLYGTSIDEIDYENCEIETSTIQETIEEKEVSTFISTTTTVEAYANTLPGEIGTDKSLDSAELTTTESSNIFKMRCLTSTSSSSASLSSSSSSSSSAEIDERNLGGFENDFLQFPTPSHKFELHLNAENNTASVIVEDPLEINIIWFNEMSYNSASFEYDCMSYELPSLVVGPLMENTTYTFCILPIGKNNITPFNCLPLYVPIKQEENIWISEDKREFTIGMLCLIFLLSTIAGALIAYFGIKSYPDLLEGSKNVLIVKKPDQACYVSTISETEYQKQSSLKKKKPSVKKEASFKKQVSIKLPLPETPKAETPPPPFHMSVRDLERLSSLKSSSTCFEDTFPAYAFQDDEYETPKICSNEYTIEQRSVPNKYGMSPGSPPPLPKRNSNISDSTTLVTNRFSNKMD